MPTLQEAVLSVTSSQPPDEEEDEEEVLLGLPTTPTPTTLLLLLLGIHIVRESQVAHLTGQHNQCYVRLDEVVDGIFLFRRFHLLFSRRIQSQQHDDEQRHARAAAGGALVEQLALGIGCLTRTSTCCTSV